MIKLIDFKDENLYRGYVLKFENIINPEDSLCLMICEIAGKYEFQLMVINGYKAGTVYWHIPNQAISKDKMGISAKWLIENSKLWETDQYFLENLYILEEPNANIFAY